MNIRKLLGLYPRKIVEGNDPFSRPKNPKALESAFARAMNFVRAPFRLPNGSLIFPRLYDGSVLIADGLGRFLSGYAPPLPDELFQRAGTLYKSGMNLITQPLWNQLTYLDFTTTQLTPFGAISNGITGNMEAAGLIVNPKSFILRVPRIIVNLAASSATGGATAIPAALNDIALLIYNGFHTLRVSDKDFFRIPIYLLPGGAGLGNTALSADTVTGGSILGAANHGVADPNATYVLIDPLYLETQVGFQAFLDWPTAQNISANQVITVAWDGQFIRPVN